MTNDPVHKPNGCQRLEDPSVKLVELSTGNKVCTYCPEWMIECEAKAILAKPLSVRQSTLLKLEAQRGPKNVQALKNRMALIFGQRKLHKSDESQ